jgi:hypothetical protein
MSKKKKFWGKSELPGQLGTLFLFLFSPHRIHVTRDIRFDGVFFSLLIFRHKLRVQFRCGLKGLRKIPVSHLSFQHYPDVYLCLEWILSDFPRESDFVDLRLHPGQRKRPSSYEDMVQRYHLLYQSLRRGYLYTYFPVSLLQVGKKYCPTDVARTACLLALGNPALMVRVRRYEAFPVGSKDWTLVDGGKAWRHIERFLPDRADAIRQRVESGFLPVRKSEETHT